MKALPVVRGRLLEWSLAAVVVAGLGMTFGFYANRVRGQSEGAAIRMTLGALRATLANEDLRRRLAVSRTESAPDKTNPFALLGRRPASYRGEADDARSADELVTPGGWIYERHCGCIAYRPLDSQWLDSASGERLMWFHVVSAVQVVPREAYQWQGELID